MSVGGHRLDAVVSNQYRLAHFPIRSANQCLKKYLVGWLSNLARRDSALFDWADFYNELKYSSSPDLAVLQRMAYGYDANEPQGLVHDPLDLSHCEVLAPPGLDRDASLCVLDFAESLALAYSELAVADNPAAHDPPRRPSDQTLQVIKEYRSYPGWLSDREACGLYESLVRSQADEPLVVELGTWQGRSAYVLGSALRSIGGGALHCVDLFDGTGDVVSAPHYAAHLKHRPEENASQVLHALRMRLPEVDVSIHVGRSDEIPTAIEGRVDFIFFDASHDEAAVAKDLEAWLPRVREGTRPGIPRRGFGIPYRTTGRVGAQNLE